MSDLKKKIEEYLPTLRDKKQKEKDKDKKRVLQIKIDELKHLRDQL